MGENIMFVCEKKETNLGDALIARNMTMTNFIGLGPPDLVILEKNYAPPKMLIASKPSKHSYFHWNLGNDVSSSAAVATYLGFLLENQEKHSFGKGTYTIDKCYSCSYNAFRKMDMRVEITVPEPARKHNGYGIDAYAVDAVGNRHELDELFWKETHVCAMLRLIEGPPSSLRPIKIKDALNDPTAEITFLNYCMEVFPQGRKLGNPENAYSLYGIDVSNNALTSILCKYFIQRNRFEHMVGFFDNFINIDPVVSVPISYAEAMLDRSPRALTLLDTSLRRKPDSSSIMLSLAELNLLNLPIGLERHIKLLETLKTALNGISLQPNLARGWWILSKCLIEMGRYEWSLVVMNNAPVVNEDFTHQTTDTFGGNSGFSKFTNPELFVNHILTIIQDEENNFKDEIGDASLRLLAAPSISSDEKTVYGLLSDIISRSSWDHLTKIRTRVLVRPAEMDKAKSRFLRSDSLQSSSLPSSSSSSVVVPTVEQPQALQEEDASALEREKENIEIDKEIEQAREEAANQKDDNKLYQSTDSDAPPHIQQSTEFSPIPRTTKQALENEEKDKTIEQVTDLKQTQEILASSIDSTEMQDVSIGNGSEAQTSFSIARDLDVDDALTKFLVHVISSRTGIPAGEVSTTPMNIEVASSPLIPVKDISRNVDVAFHAIFQDIKAFHAWKEEEKKLNLLVSEDLPARMIPTRSVADWIRIANMCERLSFTKDSAKIYKMLEHSHFKALQAIVALDAERGDIKSTLLDASNLLSRYSHPSLSSSSTVASTASANNKVSVQQPHPLVVNAIVKLVASHGAHKVRTMQSSMPYLHPLLPPVVQDVVRWKSRGFDA